MKHSSFHYLVQTSRRCKYQFAEYSIKFILTWKSFHALQMNGIRPLCPYSLLTAKSPSFSLRWMDVICLNRRTLANWLNNNSRFDCRNPQIIRFSRKCSAFCVRCLHKKRPQACHRSRWRFRDTAQKGEKEKAPISAGHAHNVSRKLRSKGRKTMILSNCKQCCKLSQIEITKKEFDFRWTRKRSGKKFNWLLCQEIIECDLRAFVFEHRAIKSKIKNWKKNQNYGILRFRVGKLPAAMNEIQAGGCYTSLHVKWFNHFHW